VAERAYGFSQYKDMERKQLNDWLITLLTRSPALTRQELEEIKHTLSEQLVPASKK